ncbi:MAG: peptidase M6, partial [Prevotella sp.]|nr:peptidase M6 [Prevotella sp.]
DNDATGHEYIIIENVQKTGWNERLLSSGMMITHVDYNETAFKLPQNRPNNEIGHSRYTIIPADGEYLSSYNIYDPDPDDPNDKVPEGKYTTATYEASMAKDLYPGPDNVTSISEFTMYTGTMNKPFYNIKEENGIVTFDFLEATGIKGVNEEVVEDNRIFAIDGTFMGTDRSVLKKGIYIVNNKKVVIR